MLVVVLMFNADADGFATAALCVSVPMLVTAPLSPTIPVPNSVAIPVPSFVAITRINFLASEACWFMEQRIASDVPHAIHCRKPHSPRLAPCSCLQSHVTHLLAVNLLRSE